MEAHRVIRGEVRELHEVEDLVRHGGVDAREAPLSARIEVVGHDRERAAGRVGSREGDAECPRHEARDVQVGARVRPTLVGQRRMESAPLVVVERPVGGSADELDVVGNSVGVVVVQRRRVDAEHDVVDDGPFGRVRALGRRVVVVDLVAVRGHRGLGERDVGRTRALRGRGRRRGQEEKRAERRGRCPPPPHTAATPPDRASDDPTGDRLGIAADTADEVRAAP